MIQVESNLVELVPDHPLFWYWELALLHEVLDEVAVSLDGRDSTSRRMRLREVAELLQYDEFVADRCRAHAHLADPLDGA